MRIASLLASATEIVCALGLEEALAAISHECDFPPHVLDRPRVSRPRFDPASLDSAGIDAAVRTAMAEHGSVYALDEDTLRAVQPDLVITQAVCEVCAVPTTLAQEAVRALDGRPEVLSLDAHTVDGILETIAQVGAAAGAVDAAAQLIGSLRARVQRVRERVSGTDRPRVLALEWLDPPFTPGHWGPEMVELAGGTNLVGTTGLRSLQTTWSRLADTDPDVLLVMPCGYGLERSVEEADGYADRLLATAPRAVRAGRAFVFDGSSYFNRSGPRVVDGIEVLAAVLHPERVDDVEIAGKATAWRPRSGAAARPDPGNHGGVPGAGARSIDCMPGTQTHLPAEE